jgi:cytochrome c556
MPYNAQAAELAGTRIEVLAGMIKQTTAADTSKLVPGTEARPIIWTERADFETKADNLVKAAATLKAAAKGGDQAATMKAMADVGASCKSCHDKFRDEKR